MRYILKQRMFLKNLKKQKTIRKLFEKQPSKERNRKGL